MNNFQKMFYFTVSFLLLSSCSVFKQKISAKNLVQLKKIAVISDLGPILHYHYAGATSFRNRHQEIVNSWDLDSSIVNNALELLKKNPQFELIEIKGSNFSKKPHFDQLVNIKKNGAAIEPYLNQLKDEGFDGLILIQAWRQTEDETITPGYGIYYDNRLLIHEQKFYFTAKIRVYSTHKKIELSSTDFLAEPYTELKSYPMRKKYEEWPIEDMAKIKEELNLKLASELPRALTRLGLIE